MVESQVLDKLEIPEGIKKILRDFIVKAKERLGDVEIYLFGSYARGDWLRDSDIDLIIISTLFKDLDMGKRYRIVRELLPTEISVELLLYTPEEFERIKKKSIILQDVIEYWIKLL
ncbi:MAG: nucleotidyltransferase domain-containing protein [Ignisphaera sp.]